MSDRVIASEPFGLQGSGPSMKPPRGPPGPAKGGAGAPGGGKSGPLIGLPALSEVTARYREQRGARGADQREQGACGKCRGHPRPGRDEAKHHRAASQTEVDEDAEGACPTSSLVRPDPRHDRAIEGGSHERNTDRQDGSTGDQTRRRVDEARHGQTNGARGEGTRSQPQGGQAIGQFREQVQGERVVTDRFAKPLRRSKIGKRRHRRHEEQGFRDPEEQAQCRTRGEHWNDRDQQTERGEVRKLRQGQRHKGCGENVDAAPVLLLTTASLRTAASHYSSGVWDPRRFRPNILIDLGGEGWIEDSWVGRQVQVGRVTVIPIQPCIRCAMVTRSQPGFDADVDIFRILARHHRGHLGVVRRITPGNLSVGDRVCVVSATSAHAG